LITTRIHPQETVEETIEAQHAGLERLGCPACYEGFVYIGHEVFDEETGEEEIVHEAVECRRCQLR
jgi:hypothetical protein